MKIKTITYQRVINLGNYESKRLEATVELNEDDNLQEKTQQLIDYVETTLKPESIKPEDF